MEKLNDLILKFCPPLVLACWLDIKDLFILMLVLILLDNITALYQAYKFRDCKKRWFNHKKMRTTIEKFIAYGIALIVAWILERVFNRSFGLPSLVAGYISMVEATSVFYHLSIITNNLIFTNLIEMIKTKIKFNNGNKRKNKVNANKTL